MKKYGLGLFYIVLYVCIVSLGSDTSAVVTRWDYWMGLIALYHALAFKEVE
jgi:hypothetical protein